MPAPSIGRVVHYVSYGTPGGEFGSECRAAIVAAVKSVGAADDSRVSLVVLNPNGIYFNEDCMQSEVEHIGGYWHWPERVD